MTVVDRVYRDTSVPDSAGAYARDTVTLGWQDRTHVHGRRRTDGGVEFGTSLPRGTVLRAGDVLVLDDDRVVATVIEEAEPVFVIAPGSSRDWALFAYQIGNRHQPLMVTESGLVCPDLPGVEQVLRQHHMPYSRATLPFTPAATTAGHSH